MKTLATLLIVAAGVGLAACDKPRTNSAYNNSGASATPNSSSTPAATTTSASTASDAPASAGGAMNEAATTGKIKSAIATDDMLKGSDISVTTANGIVTLTGTAKTQDQVSEATGLAQKQEGVTRVDANVTVQ